MFALERLSSEEVIRLLPARIVPLTGIEAYLQRESAAEVLIQKAVYGETLGLTPETLNTRGRTVRIVDQPSVSISEVFDFKGNPLRESRQFATDYKDILDWFKTVPLEQEIFSASYTFDALSRGVDTVP